MDSNVIYNSDWKSGLCWGNLAGCLAFYHTLSGFTLMITSFVFLFISSEHNLAFTLSGTVGFVIVLMGMILLPLVFSCVLGRQYHIYATVHGYLIFLINISSIVLIVFMVQEMNSVKSLKSLSSRLLLADLSVLLLTSAVGLVAWIVYVGRQFHEPNGQFILQLWLKLWFVDLCICSINETFRKKNENEKTPIELLSVPSFD